VGNDSASTWPGGYRPEDEDGAGCGDPSADPCENSPSHAPTISRPTTTAVDMGFFTDRRPREPADFSTQ
jgi:hypothetical protein